MKNILIIIGLLLTISLNISDEIIEVLSDISGILFFMFTVLSMICISTIIAMEIAKTLQYQILEKELNILKEEMYMLQSQNIFSIEFTQEACDLENSLKVLNQKILTLKEKNYETI